MTSAEVGSLVVGRRVIGRSRSTEGLIPTDATIARGCTKGKNDITQVFRLRPNGYGRRRSFYLFLGGGRWEGGERLTDPPRP